MYLAVAIYRFYVLRDDSRLKKYEKKTRLPEIRSDASSIIQRRTSRTILILRRNSYTYDVRADLSRTL